MKLEDMTFTEKQAKRILAEATEREARDYGEKERTIGYNELVQIAQEASIDPKYLKVSTKQLVKESGGLEKVAMRRMYTKTLKFGKRFTGCFLEGFFTIPTAIRKHPEEDDTLFGVAYLGGLSYSVIFLMSLALVTASDGPKQLIPYFIGLAALTTLTQFGSGFYEWYRHEKNKLLEEMNGKE